MQQLLKYSVSGGRFDGFYWKYRTAYLCVSSRIWENPNMPVAYFIHAILEHNLKWQDNTAVQLFIINMQCTFRLLYTSIPWRNTWISDFKNTHLGGWYTFLLIAILKSAAYTLKETAQTSITCLRFDHV